MDQLILVSKSPRRRKILKDEGYIFTSVSIETSEYFDKNLSLNNALKKISKLKVQTYLDNNSQQNFLNHILIGCDTLVCIDEQVLGKPENKEQNIQYLRLMSGRAHEVKTALSIFNFNKLKWIDHVETSKVIMKDLTDLQIDSYVNTGEPADKAGGYGIQGLGGQLVEKYEGSWLNIVGFPIKKFNEIVTQEKWNLKK